MRISVLALVLTGFAAGPVGFAAGQQQESTESKTGELRNLLGEVKSLDQFTALQSNYGQAFDRNDAAAMAGFYADYGVAVTPDGWFCGREAIQEWYKLMFQQWQPSHSIWQYERLTGTDNEASGMGRWFGTVQSQNGPMSVNGLWSTEYVRVGTEWKIRSATFNVSCVIPLEATSTE